MAILCKVLSMKTTSTATPAVTPHNKPLESPLESKVGCIASAMEIIGNKWTALILRDLFEGSRRFCELEKSVGSINPRTLSQRLDDLEAHGIITRKRFAEVPPRIDYTLTQKGRDLLPILQQMATWGNKYYDAKSV
ncbi:MAG: transcriptional regulator [Candidatus Saccharibacteria bacterium]|nr:transcriptional regulator [Candidatus Saccharibacteria bacterium]